MRLLPVACFVILLTLFGGFTDCHAQGDGATLTLTGGGGATIIGGTLSGGNLTINSTSVLGDLATFQINNNLTLNGITFSAGATLNSTVNAGTISLIKTTSTNLVYLPTGGSLVLNSAIGEIYGGTVTLTGSAPIFVAGTDPISVASGATLTLGSGNLGVNEGTIALTGLDPGLIIPTYGSIVVPSTGTLTLNAGTFTAASGTLTITGTSPSIFYPTNGGITVGATGTVTLNSGTLVPTAGGTLNLTGASSITLTPGSGLITTTRLGVPISTLLTVNVTPGSNFQTLPSVGSINVTGGTVASFLGGVNAGGGTVSLLYLPAVQNLVSNPLQLHVSEFDNGAHGKYVLEMSYNPATAATLGDALDNYLSWFDPSDGTWKNAVFGNSDGGASAHFVDGAYDPTKDFNLGWYGVDPTNDEVWAVVDHNSTFGVANEDTEPIGDPNSLTPSGVPEPSTLGLLACGLALLGRRRRR